MLTTKEIRQLIAEGREDEVPKEDLETFKENEERREVYSQRGIKNLYKAVCLQAVNDNKQARKYLGRKVTKPKERAQATRDKAETEHFFASEFFKNVSGCRSEKKTIRAIEASMAKEAQNGFI